MAASGYVACGGAPDKTLLNWAAEVGPVPGGSTPLPNADIYVRPPSHHLKQSGNLRLR